MTKLVGVPDGQEATTGHPALLDVRPAFELGRMPEGGGYPVGFVQTAARILGCADVGQILHLCSGSVGAPLTVDAREQLRPSIVADVRWLPIRPGSQRYILADPPYSQDHAEALWSLGKQYPTPTVLLREAAQALAPGGRVGLLHFVVPRMPVDLVRLGVWGVTIGPGYRIRAFTVAEKVDDGQFPGGM